MSGNVQKDDDEVRSLIEIESSCLNFALIIPAS